MGRGGGGGGVFKFFSQNSVFFFIDGFPNCKIWTDKILHIGPRVTCQIQVIHWLIMIIWPKCSKCNQKNWRRFGDLYCTNCKRRSLDDYVLKPTSKSVQAGETRVGLGVIWINLFVRPFLWYSFYWFDLSHPTLGACLNKSLEVQISYLNAFFLSWYYLFINQTATLGCLVN